MKVSNETKQKFYKDYGIEFIEDIMLILCSDIKKLDINIRFKDKLVIDMLKVKEWITNIVSNYENVDEVIDVIEDYWRIKLSTIKRIYDCRISSRSYQKHQKLNDYDFTLTDNQIKIIKQILNIYKLDTLLNKFNSDEQIILKMINNDVNPYTMASLRYPVRMIIIYIERINDVLVNYKISEELKGNVNIKQKELVYLNKIVIVKNWAYCLPKELRGICFKAGLKTLSELLDKHTDVTDCEIRKTLNNLKISDIAPNDKKVLVSNDDILSYLPKDELEREIIKFYFSDLDESYKPNLINTYQKKYGYFDSELIKTKAASKIIKNNNE